jgi:hypothetical protein
MAHHGMQLPDLGVGLGSLWLGLYGHGEENDENEQQKTYSLHDASTKMKS